MSAGDDQAPSWGALEQEARQVDAEHAPNASAETTEQQGGAQEGEVLPPGATLEEATTDARLLMAGLGKFTEAKYGVGLSPETREKGAAKLAPLLLKYDLDSPFLRKWRLEIDAAMFFGGVAYGVYEAVQARKMQEGAGDGGE